MLMRQHEILYFIDGLTAFLRTRRGEGPQALPTREELSVNFYRNKDRFTGAGSAWRNGLHDVIERGYVRQRPCGPGCHARHIELTATGRTALSLWNRDGCDSEHETGEACERGSRFEEAS